MAGFFTRLIPLDSWTLLAWRGVFGAIGLAIVILAMERRTAWRKVRDMGWSGWVFAIVSAIGMVLFITSLRHTTVAHVAVIYATVPFIAAALAWLVMRERSSPSAVVASLAALVGVILMVGLGAEGGLYGDFLALCMTFCMAAMMVIARRFHNIPTLPAACLSALMSGLVCWPFGNPLNVSEHDLFLLSLFGLVNSAVGLALFTIGARLLPAIETALIRYYVATATTPPERGSRRRPTIVAWKTHSSSAASGPSAPRLTASYRLPKSASRGCASTWTRLIEPFASSILRPSQVRSNPSCHDRATRHSAMVSSAGPCSGYCATRRHQ